MDGPVLPEDNWVEFLPPDNIQLCGLGDLTRVLCVLASFLWLLALRKR